MTDQHRFVVLGTGALFTRQVVQTLLEQACPPLAYIQSSSQAETPGGFSDINVEVEPQPALKTLLQTYSVPIYFQPRDRSMAELICGLQADYLLVACWPELLPGDVLDSVSTAALNLHPSLLPNFRGPNPIQTQLDINDNNFGITLHIMNEQYDAGDIVMQKKLPTPIKRDRLTIETIAAEQGALLFINAVKTHEQPGWTLTQQQ